MTKAPHESAMGGAPLTATTLVIVRKSPDTNGLASQSEPSPPAAILSQSHPQRSSKLANLLTQAAASQTKELLKAQKFKDAALDRVVRAGAPAPAQPAGWIQPADWICLCVSVSVCVYVYYMYTSR